MNNKTEIDFLNYDDLNLVEEKIKECTDRANEAMSPQINKIIDGKSTQETTTGKNLLDTKTLLVQSRTVNGLNYLNNGNGTFNISGTTTKTTSLELIQISKDFFDFSKTYYFYCSQNYNVTKFNLCFQIRKNDGNTIFFIANKSLDFSTIDKSKVKTIGLVFYAKANTTINSDNNVKLMIVEGDTPPSYEPYTGGQPSPSPDYPSEIENVKGKNLFDKNKKAKLINAKKDILNTGVRATLTSPVNWARISIDIGKKELLGKTISYGAEFFVSGQNGGRIALYFGSSTKEAIQLISYLEQTGTKTTTIPSNFPSGADRINILVYASTRDAGNIGDYVDYTNLMVVEGSMPNRYVPYGNIQIVETGKNLLNLPNSINTNVGMTVSIIDNKVSFIGTPTRGYANSYSLPFSLKAGTYSFSNTNNNYDFYLWLRNSSNTTIGNIHLRRNNPTQTINLNEEVTAVQIGVESLTVGTQYNIDAYFQIEKGSTATNYEPYKEEVVNIDLKGNELCSLPNGTKDELIVKDGRAKILKRIGKVVLDGSENWTDQNNGSYVINVPTKYNRYGTDGLICDHFHLRTGTSTTNYKGIDNDTTRIRVWNVGMTLANFKTWLSTHNTIVQYELAEPYEIDLGPLEVYFTYETKKWEINELPYIQEIDRIEKGIYNLGEKYNRPKGWLTTKEWITKDNLYPIKGFDYRDWNRWVNNLNLFTTDIVVKDTIWNRASFINWEQIGKDEWR